MHRRSAVHVAPASLFVYSLLLGYTTRLVGLVADRCQHEYPQETTGNEALCLPNPPSLRDAWGLDLFARRPYLTDAIHLE